MQIGFLPIINLNCTIRHDLHISQYPLTVGVGLPNFAQHFYRERQGAFIAFKGESLVDPGLAEIAVHDVALNISGDHAVRRTVELRTHHVHLRYWSHTSYLHVHLY